MPPETRELVMKNRLRARELMMHLTHPLSDNKDFYLRSQVLIRNKDHDRTGLNPIVKRFTIRSYEDYLRYEDEIIKLVIDNKARYYVNPTPVSFKSVTLDMMDRIVMMLKQDDDYSFIRKMYDSTADRNPGIKHHRLWIIDIDLDIDFEEVETIVKTFASNRMNINYAVKTKNGYHLLIEPQNDQYLHKLMHDLGYSTLDYEIKRNSITEVLNYENL